jgi:toxin CptA
MDLATLEPRLENWARAQSSFGGSGACIASAEGMYRRPGVLYREEAIVLPPIDQRDANLVNEAWKRCMPVDRDVLRMHYVWRAHSSFICRRLKLKQGRGHEHVWDFALYHAHQAIAARLEKVDDLAKPIRYAYNRAEMTESVD